MRSMKRGSGFEIAGIAGSGNGSSGAFGSFRVEEIASGSRGQRKKKECGKRMRGTSAP